MSADEADRILTVRLQGTAKRHARWRELTADEHAAAVAELRELAAGIMEGASEGEMDEPLMRQAAQLCHDAGADEALIPAWIEEGRRRRANALRRPFSAPRRTRPGQHPPGRGG